MQRYYCKNCLRKFADNDAIPGMKTPIWVIALALNSYFDGMSVGAIQKEINQRHGAYYAQSTIYNWIIRFADEAVKQASSFQPAVSDRWLLSITPVIKNNNSLEFMDIFDIDSEFLLGSQLVKKGKERNSLDFVESIHAQTRITLNHPVTVFVPENIYDYTLTTENSEKKTYWMVKAAKNRMEEYGKLLKKRKSVVRNFANIRRAQTFTAAWKIHYNFLTENAVSRLTVKSAAAPFHNWTDIIYCSAK
jgi:transposase-like protein